MKNKIWYAVLAVSLLVIAAAFFNIYRLSEEYKKGIDEYKELEQYAVIKEEPQTMPLKAEEGNAGEEQEKEQETQAVTKETASVSIDIKFEELMKMNEDFTGWLYYEPLGISYPIVRGNDNEYYTKQTFEKKANSSGAIFMDFLNRRDFSDFNTIIYGHNMRNGTMFGSLKKLLSDTSLIKENPFFYIFTQNKTYKYEIFSAYVTDESSDTYNLIEDEAAQEEYLDYIKASSEYLSEKAAAPKDKLVTLSTCHGLHSASRTVVHGVLITEEDR